MLVSVADYVGVSKSSAGRIVRDVSQAIARLYPKYIYVHNNTQEDFYKIGRFPRVLGAIDGTHILMQSPSKCLPTYSFSCLCKKYVVCKSLLMKIKMHFQQIQTLVKNLETENQFFQ